jgi:hypothetical protein
MLTNVIGHNGPPFSGIRLVLIGYANTNEPAAGGTDAGFEKPSRLMHPQSPGNS